jgi:transcriptional regulator with XRE-family HTH domain
MCKQGVDAMTNKEVGEMIRTRRMARGMTQDDLADKIGITASAVGMFENGKRRPKDEVAEAIADVFNIPKWAVYFSEEEVGVMTRNFTPQEMMLLDIFRAVDDIGRMRIIQVCMNEKDSAEERRIAEEGRA